jgi:hypothetical protein
VHKYSVPAWQGTSSTSAIHVWSIGYYYFKELIASYSVVFSAMLKRKPDSQMQVLYKRCRIMLAVKGVN